MDFATIHRTHSSFIRRQNKQGLRTQRPRDPVGILTAKGTGPVLVAQLLWEWNLSAAGFPFDFQVLWASESDFLIGSCGLEAVKPAKLTDFTKLQKALSHCQVFPASGWFWHGTETMSRRSDRPPHLCRSCFSCAPPLGVNLWAGPRDRHAVYGMSLTACLLARPRQCDLG